MAFFLSGPDQTLPLYIWGQLRFPTTLPMILALGNMLGKMLELSGEWDRVDPACAARVRVAEDAGD